MVRPKSLLKLSEEREGPVGTLKCNGVGPKCLKCNSRPLTSINDTEVNGQNGKNDYINSTIKLKGKSCAV